MNRKETTQLICSLETNENYFTIDAKLDNGIYNS